MISTGPLSGSSGRHPEQENHSLTPSQWLPEHVCGPLRLAGVVCSLLSLKQAAAECLANVIHHLKSPAGASFRALARRRRAAAAGCFKRFSVINGSLQSHLEEEKNLTYGL